VAQITRLFVDMVSNPGAASLVLAQTLRAFFGTTVLRAG
jgi:hypothetical protein